MINEEAAAQQYLLDLLTADATLGGLINGVWLRSVPEREPLPAVKIDRQDASDLMVVGLGRVWADLHMLIRGIVHWDGGGQPDWSAVRAIGDRIDTVLHRHDGSNTVVGINVWREEAFTDETVEGGDLFLHVGGVYRILARAL